MSKILEKENEYKDYINEHIKTVKLVWSQFKKVAAEKLTYDQEQLIDRLIIDHDKSKFDAQEFYGYRQYFYPCEKAIVDESEFDISWNHHQNNNPHHWEYWIMYDGGKNTVLPMRETDIIEMLCDWTAMSIKFGNTPSRWFYSHEKSLRLHTNTYDDVKYYLPYFDKIYEALKG